MCDNVVNHLHCHFTLKQHLFYLSLARSFYILLLHTMFGFNFSATKYKRRDGTSTPSFYGLFELIIKGGPW